MYIVDFSKYADLALVYLYAKKYIVYLCKKKTDKYLRILIRMSKYVYVCLNMGTYIEIRIRMFTFKINSGIGLCWAGALG